MIVGLVEGQNKGSARCSTFSCAHNLSGYLVIHCARITPNNYGARRDSTTNIIIASIIFVAASRPIINRGQLSRRRKWPSGSSMIRPNSQLSCSHHVDSEREGKNQTKKFRSETASPLLGTDDDARRGPASLPAAGFSPLASDRILHSSLAGGAAAPLSIGLTFPRFSFSPLCGRR